MAQLTGKVKSMRLVSGKYKKGKRQGEDWEFLSFEIIDDDSGLVWSCQLPSEDPNFKQVKDGDSLVRHLVTVTVMSQTAGEREVGEEGNRHKIMQVRSQIADLIDRGLPKANRVA